MIRMSTLRFILLTNAWSKNVEELHATLLLHFSAGRADVLGKVFSLPSFVMLVQCDVADPASFVRLPPGPTVPSIRRAGFSELSNCDGLGSSSKTLSGDIPGSMRQRRPERSRPCLLPPPRSWTPPSHPLARDRRSGAFRQFRRSATPRCQARGAAEALPRCGVVGLRNCHAAFDRERGRLRLTAALSGR